MLSHTLTVRTCAHAAVGLEENVDNHKSNAVLRNGEEGCALIMSIEAHHSQLTAEGYVRLLSPSDTRLIDTDYSFC